MERRKRSRAETTITPDILFFRILPRLPVKSVLRFKFVSNQWRSILTSSVFRKTQLHLQHVINTKKLVVIPPMTFNFHIIDCERPQNGFTPGLPLPFELSHLTIVQILTSVHGMVCLGIIKAQPRPADHIPLVKYSDLILWNPETGQHKTLSKPNHFDEHDDCYVFRESLFGLYHSSWDDDYKLLRVTRFPSVYIYSLKSDSWRKVESDFQRARQDGENPLLSNFSWVASDSLDENLYFLEYNRKGSYSVMRFNTKNETLKLIATPFSDRVTWFSFMVLRDGCIQLWMNIGNSALSHNELWRMEGDGDWSKVENSGMMVCEPITYRYRLHLMRNGNLLMLGDHGCIFQQDMKTHNKHFCSSTSETLRVFPGGKYIETLVSPNQYIIK